MLDTLSKNGIVPIRVNKKYTFYKNGRTTFLYIISTDKGLARKYKESKIPNVSLASYHTYVLHDFKTIKMRRNVHNFKYSTKEMGRNNFILKLDLNYIKLIYSEFKRRGGAWRMFPDYCRNDMCLRTKESLSSYK